MEIAEIRRQNLRKLVDAHGTQQDFSNGIGMSVQYINQLLNGHRNIGEKTARKIESAAKIPKLTLDIEPSGLEVREPPNVYPGPQVRGVVPLISWVSAGQWREVIDALEPRGAEEWIETTAPILRHTFALRVSGDSMEPDFPAGVFIVVEPDIDPQQGDFVIARNGDEATFKQLVKDGADWYLKPLNPRYPIKPLESPCKIIGVVREAIRRFR